MENAEDARLEAVMESVVRHLHAFLRKTRPTEPEFEAALRWIARRGQFTDESRNEVVLAADILGASTLIDLIDMDGMQGETMSALLGPFYRGEAPEIENGGAIVYSDTPGPELVVSGHVRDCDGKPLAGALTVVTAAGEAALGPLDSVRVAPGEERALENRANAPASVLLATPETAKDRRRR